MPQELSDRPCCLGYLAPKLRLLLFVLLFSDNVSLSDRVFLHIESSICTENCPASCPCNRRQQAFSDPEDNSYQNSVGIV